MAASVSKRLSLVEQKRIQWAKEREELAGLCAPWGLPPKDSADLFRSSIRTHFASAAAAADHLKARRQQQEEQQLQLQHQHQQQQQQQQQQLATPDATAGLPPIPGARAGDPQESQAECSCREDEGDTSGYGSEANDCALHPHLPQRRLQRAAFWDAAARSEHGHGHGISSADSTSSAAAAGRGSADEASRLRWGDRGVGVGHLWDPVLLQPDHRLPQVVGGDTPGWLERGLRRLGSQPDAQVLVVGQGPRSARADSSGHSSPSGCASIDRTYIRGQNVPIPPEELLERETKRQKALEHQKAIREQLEERERRRKEERERRMREEQLEEARLRRDRELEAQRLRDEQRRRKDKELQDARRAQAIREALAEAERRAQRDRGQLPRRHEATAHAHSQLQQQQHQQQQQHHHQQQQQQQQHQQQQPPAGPGAPATPAQLLRHQETVVATDGVAVVVDGRELLEAVGAAAAAAAPGGGGGLQLALLLPQQVLAERRDAATQTAGSGRGADKKSASLERLPRPVRLPSRCRSQSQSRAAPDARPRWGARPPAHAHGHGHAHAHAHGRLAEQRRPARTRPQAPPVPHSSDDNSRSPSPPATTASAVRALKEAAAAGAQAAGQRGMQRLVSLEVRTPRRPADPGGNVSVKLLNRRMQESAPTIVQDSLPERSENWDSKRPLLTRLSTLRESLLQKQQEWEISRSQTPYSEQSWQS